MKQLLLLLVAFLLATQTKAQEQNDTKWAIMPYVGVSLSTSTSAAIFIDTNKEIREKFTSGFTAGVDVIYRNNGSSAFSAGLNYTQAGWGYKDALFEDPKKGGTAYQNSWQRLHYVSIPLMGHLYLNERFAIKTGIQIGYLIGAKLHLEEHPYTISADGRYTYDEKVVTNINETEGLNKIDVLIPMGISYEYNNVVLDVRYAIGLTKTEKHFFTSENNRIITATVGYKFKL